MHAFYMKSIHGVKTKNDRIDSLKIARLMRGGNFPVAYVYPPEMRAARDLMRRRNHFVRKRAELISHIQNTTMQYNLEPLGTIARPHHRREKDIVGNFPDPVVQLIVETDLELTATRAGVPWKLVKVIEFETKRDAIKAENWLNKNKEHE